MKFKYNVFNFVTSIIFMLAFLCLMLSYITSIMFYPTMALFCAGFVMLSIRFIKNYNKQNVQLEQKQETIVMELSSGEDGEKYVMQDDNSSKKARRKKRIDKFDRFLPSLFMIFASILFLYLLVSRIVVAVK